MTKSQLTTSEMSADQREAEPPPVVERRGEDQQPEGETRPRPVVERAVDAVPAEPVEEEDEKGAPRDHGAEREDAGGDQSAPHSERMGDRVEDDEDEQGPGGSGTAAV